MGSGGVIFIVIIGLWAFYLVPVVMRELSERARAREFGAESDSARVLQRPPAERDARRVVLTAGRPAVRDDLPARATGPVARDLRQTAERDRTATRIRGWAALLGAAGLAVTVLAAALTTFPWWSVTVAGGWLGAVVAAGAVAASGRRRRRGRVLPRVDVSASVRPSVRTPAVLFDDRPAAVAAPAARAAVVSEVPVATEQTWTPVSVPLPTYTAKTVSQRPPALPWSFPAVGPTAAEAVVASAAAEPAPQLAGPQGPAAAEAAEDEQEERRSAAG